MEIADQTMEYTDEEVLRMREEKRRQTYQSIDKGIYIKGEIVDFDVYQINSKFSLCLPVTWQHMPEELAKIKYPSEFRPQSIITSSDLSINMGFSIFPHKLKAEEVKVTAKRVMEMISSDNPGHRFFRFEELEKINGYWFSFRSHTLDSDLFNQILIAPIDQMIILANFNCLYEDCGDWDNAVLQMWESIEETKEEESII